MGNHFSIKCFQRNMLVPAINKWFLGLDINCTICNCAIFAGHKTFFYTRFS